MSATPTAPDHARPEASPRCERKTARVGERTDLGVERIGEVWHVRSYESVRHVLREPGVTKQAGFNVESIRQARPSMRPPVLFQDGGEHRTQRAAIARFFAPATVTKRYRTYMESRADDIVGDIAATIAAGGTVDLSASTLRYAVDVAAQVVGLTNSDPDGMAHRLERFFSLPLVPPGEPSGLRDRLVGLIQAVRAMPPMLLFNWLDVKPAIKARRAAPQQDVISHLIEQGYNDEDILIECVTYGAAGMVTTREFISMVTWHLLDRPELRERYLVAGEKERYAILDEVLRLEPVVGHLYRRTTTAIDIPDGEATYHVPAGELLDLYIRAANADERAVGAEPLRLCPGRDLAAGVRTEGMGFGDGNHRCPGNFIATQESDVFLTRLLALPLRVAADGAGPRLEWDELISGYAVRGLMLTAADMAPSGPA